MIRLMNTEDTSMRRLADLARRAGSRCCWTYSNFLDTAQQSELVSIQRELAAPFALEGGHERCERRIAVFGSEELCGYKAELPIVCVEIKPKNDNFAQELTHRDYLGSLMALGIRREATGDIFVEGKNACFFCLDTIAPYIIENLTQVSRTQVVCSLTDDPPIPEPRFERLRINAASERLDAVIGAVWHLSRGTAAELIKAGKVAVDARVCENTSHMLKPEETVSARGFGKFIFRGIETGTRKGRYFMNVDVYM